MKFKNILLIWVLACGMAACAVPVMTAPVGQTAVVPVPVVVGVASQTVENQSDKPIYVCSIKPFFETYRSENVSRGKAKLAVQKQCLAKNEAMFCEEKDIVCQVYE